MKSESNTIGTATTCQGLLRNCTNPCCPCCLDSTNHPGKCISKPNDVDILHMYYNDNEIRDESWQDDYRANRVAL